MSTRFAALGPARPGRLLARGVTLIELLVTLAILALLFALLIRPMASALEIVNLGTARSEVDTRARLAIRQLTEELSQALYVRSNFGYLDTVTGEVRAPQLSRIDVVLPDDTLESGLLHTPLLPEIDAGGNPLLVTYLVTLKDPFQLKDGAFQGHDPIENPYVLYRFQYPLLRGLPDPELLSPDDPDLARPEYAWAQRYYDPLGPDQEPVVPPFDAFGAASVSALTGRETDVVETLFLPREVRNERLQAAENFTRFTAHQGNWIRPYQVNGTWVLPGSLHDANGILQQPAFVLIRDGTPLYYLDVNNDPNVNPALIAGSTVGHVMVYQVNDPANPADDVAVYDTSLYPMRAITRGHALFTPFACGVDWERGEILTVFENTDPGGGEPYDKFKADGSVQYPLRLDANLLPEASIVPGSVQVNVSWGGAARSYRVLESRGGGFLQPGPGECHVNLDPDAQGRFVLTFHFRPQDDWNPPAPGAQIEVRYRYLTHAFASGRPLPDTWTANYWTRNEITVRLAMDLPTNSQLVTRERQRVRLQSVIQIRNAQKRH